MPNRRPIFIASIASLEGAEYPALDGSSSSRVHDVHIRRVHIRSCVVMAPFGGIAVGAITYTHTARPLYLRLTYMLL